MINESNSSDDLWLSVLRSIPQSYCDGLCDGNGLAGDSQCGYCYSVRFRSARDITKLLDDYIAAIERTAAEIEYKAGINHVTMSGDYVSLEDSETQKLKAQLSELDKANSWALNSSMGDESKAKWYSYYATRRRNLKKEIENGQ